EDGIRDRNVTGVQTCALPIYVADVEADFHLRTTIGNVEDLFRFFLFRVVGGDFQLVFADIKTYAAEFLVRENRRASKRLLEQIEIGRASCREGVACASAEIAV